MKKWLFIACTFALVNWTSATPIISFFNEMKSKELVALFQDTSIIPELLSMHAQIRMGILDMTPERANIIRELNENDIPVFAWLLLPEDQGYWFNSSNGEQAIRRYQEIKKWADSNHLKFSGIGLDLELDMNDVKLFKAHPWKLLFKLPPRLYDRGSVRLAKVTYQHLIQIIKNDGYAVESYYVPFIKDEAAIGNTSIQQLTKFLDIKTDREIPMLYSSFMGNPDGLIKVYGIDAKAKYIAIGSTGGGFDTTMHTMNFENLVHDMRLAAMTADEIHIFSLEGCVKKGFLKKMIGLDISQPVIISQKEVTAVKKLRSNFILISKILSHPTILFITFLTIIALIAWLIVKLLRLVYKLINNKEPI